MELYFRGKGNWEEGREGNEGSNCRGLHRPRALPDHGVEGIGEHPPRAAVEAAYVLEVAGLPQVLLDETDVALVVQSVPDGDRLIWKAAVREGDERGRADLQDSPDLPQDFDGPGQIVDGNAAAHAIELAVLKGQRG